jgi:hypothetical protein
MISEAQGAADAAARQSALDAGAIEACRREAGLALRDAGAPWPCRTPAPAFPVGMSTEGFCDMRFDVGADGRVTNIIAACSDDGFIRASRSAVSSWLFLPCEVDGQATASVFSVKLSYRYE